MKAKQGNVLREQLGGCGRQNNATPPSTLTPAQRRSEPVNKLGGCQRGVKVTDGLEVVCKEGVAGSCLWFLGGNL